jgi:hypothetical protein
MIVFTTQTAAMEIWKTFTEHPAYQNLNTNTIVIAGHLRVITA